MYALLALQEAASSDQVLHLANDPAVYQALGIYVAIAAIGGGIVLGILLMILGQVFGAQASPGGAIGAMFLFMLVASGVTIGLVYAGMVKVSDIEAAASYGQLALAMPFGFKTFLIAIGAGFVVLVLTLSAVALDAQGDRAALGSVLFVAIIMAAIGAASFYGINYGILKFAPQYFLPIPT